MAKVRGSRPLLARVRKLLAKAEDEGVTPAEAQALTAKAAELMAKYGIDRALLAASAAGDRPAGRPGDRRRQPVGPGQGASAVRAGRGAALPVRILPLHGPGCRIHVFGYASDIERTDLLYTSLLMQMWPGWPPPVPAGAGARGPGGELAPRLPAAAVTRVRAAEH